MLRKLAIPLFLPALLLCACNSFLPADRSEISRKQTQVRQAQTSQQTEAPDLSALSDNKLPYGKCGMLLWTLNANNPVLVFRAVRGEGAEMVIDGEPARLVLVRQAGESRFGITSEQTYRSPEGLETTVNATVNADFGLTFEGGVYVENGVITLRNEAGWERVLPVAGLAGCRS